MSNRNFKGKIFLHGELELLTGLHIGCGGQSGIGLLDNPVIRNLKNRLPYIPGSSLKGRLRHAVEIIQGNQDTVTRLFGGEGQDKSPSLVFVRDCDLVSNEKDFKTEIKYENKINRITGTAEHPRQIERIPAGSKFTLELILNVYDNDFDEEKDFEYLRSAMEFVQDEYLGGSGSRGYGKVEFHVKKLFYKTKDYYLGKKEDLKSSKEGEINTSNWVEKAKELVSGKVPAKV